MIYTSRYSNPELKNGEYTVVGITRGAPKFPLQYRLDGNIMDIAPPGYLFNEYNRVRFTPAYFSHMDKIGVNRIAKILEGYESKGKPVVLCCYEDVRKPHEWCHRLVFAEWWKERTGEVIEELPDPSPNKWLPKSKTVENTPQETEAEQLKIW